MKWREYFLYAKKIKITTFIQQFVSSLSLCVSVAPFWKASDGRKVRTLFSVISNAWIHIVRLFKLCVHRMQKVFSSLHKIQIEPLDYFDDVFYTFLCLDSVIYLAVNGTVTSLPVFIQNILNCVPRTNKAFTGLERHGGKWLMTKFSFWGGVYI